MQHPYTNSTSGLISTIKQLRSTFPKNVSADTLKKWAIAPNNETYIISALSFLNIITEDGIKTPEAEQVFVIHDDEDFGIGFANLIRNSYTDLFDLYGESAWEQPKDKLISFFRAANKSSENVGTRQANTFIALGQLAGKIEGAKDKPKSTRDKTNGRKETASTAKSTKSKPNIKIVNSEENNFQESTNQDSLDKQTGTLSTSITPALTVRIEINLPVTDNQDVYDNIFRSIKENLLKQ
jgi:hypothetical protein